MTKKGGQVKELQDKLNSTEIEQKQQGIRRIIDAMTRGKDVSMLFMDVIKNMETPSLQLKKLIYLYVMNYAKAHPDLAILGINTFRKDAIDKNNPFLRGLAVRTMGCIRIKDITEYLCDPLKKALKDQDPYVRKTGALCVPKLYQIAPQLIQQQGFLKLLENLLNDGNATVVSNAVASLSICSEIKGQPMIKLTDHLVQKLLTAMNDCNQWGVVYILDTLASYIPKDPAQAQSIMERVSSRLAHTNSAVALSSIRLIIKYMDYLSHPQSIRAYNNKISAPLITMISRESQICYIVLKTMNLVLQKRPLMLPKQLKIFFVNYHDPLYVKLEKLQILAKIANNENILMILHQLKDCVQEVDVEFVRKAVRTMGRCAIKLEKMADKCVQCLWETLKTKIPYVVQQAVIVIRDIFRKYPNKYEGLLADICENLKTLDDPEAKASIVWIIGQYVEMIENADDLMANFAQNFKDESDIVQQQILISCMKLYLHKPAEGKEILKDLFKYITKECENPDLRDRGFIYWRLLSTNPQLAKKVVLSERPLISDQSYTLQTQLLDKLIENIGTLSSVYGKQPQQFVKKLKDNANAREIIQEDAEELLAKNVKEQNVQFFGEKPKDNVTFANKNQDLVHNIPSMMEAPVEQQHHKQKVQQNLLDIIEGQSTIKSKVQAPTKNNNNGSLLDLEQAPKVYNTSVPNQNKSTNNYATMNNQNVDINFLAANQSKSKNIVIPMTKVMEENRLSETRRYDGIEIHAAFQRMVEKTILQLMVINISTNQLEGLAIKLKANAFKLAPESIHIHQMDKILPGETKKANIELNNQNQYLEIQGWPYYIDCGLKVNDDIFVIRIPCLLSIGFKYGFQMSLDQYKEFVGNGGNVKKQDILPNQLNVEEFVKRLTDNNLALILRRQNQKAQLMSFGCQLVDKTRLVVDIIFEKATNAVTIQMTGPSQSILKYFYQALVMIVNL